MKTPCKPWSGAELPLDFREQEMSFKPQVQTGDRHEWTGNALRFATREEAEANVANLASRWLLVSATRVVESSDPVNYAWVDGALVAV